MTSSGHVFARGQIGLRGERAVARWAACRRPATRPTTSRRHHVGVGPRPGAAIAPTTRPGHAFLLKGTVKGPKRPGTAPSEPV